METLWDSRFAQRTQAMTSSVIREILKITARPDVISFAGGLPAPEIFPVKEFAAACDVVLSEKPSEVLQYGITEGYLPLREFLARRTEREGVTTAVENVMITTGSQQALDLIGKILINPGDKILVESPTYLGALQAWGAYGAEYIAVPADENGIRTDGLEAALRAGPKLIYVLPNFQNPTGVTLSLDRRQRLVELADKYGVPIVEDDPYGSLRFEGQHLPSVVALDAQMRGQSQGCYTGNVIYLSTFSKILAPGLRLAWVIGPPQVIFRMAQAKQGSDLHTPTFTQMVAYQVAYDGFLDRHLDVIRSVYHRRRDIMLDGMQNTFPAGVKWTRPQGGLFLWVTLPEGMDSTEILSAAVENKVAFVPGSPFFPAGGGGNTLRMNYSNATDGGIREGMSRLGNTLKQYME
ncbi:MAG: PLP-dependent aminotransferase family protein [Anaerolineales bacterium]|nr:PLP-dependent aminotransferase family protein [Anaerolineales bacterium]